MCGLRDLAHDLRDGKLVFSHLDIARKYHVYGEEVPLQPCANACKVCSSGHVNSVGLTKVSPPSPAAFKKRWSRDPEEVKVAKICDRLHINDTYSSLQFFFEASKMDGWEAILNSAFRCQEFL